MIRLTEQEQKNIKKVIREFLQTDKASLYLFGSRAKAHLKGGDIDLLLVTDEDAQKLLQEKKLMIKVKLKEVLQDQRVDLIIANQQQLENDEFLKYIFPDAKLLAKWE